MLLIGVDYHPSFQTIAFLIEETGEYDEQELNHSDGQAEKFYRGLKQRGLCVRVGMEATGHSRWFERLLAELGFELWIGDPAELPRILLEIFVLLGKIEIYAELRYIKKKMVRSSGFEPPRYCYRQPLKLVRLPVPPRPHCIYNSLQRKPDFSEVCADNLRTITLFSLLVFSPLRLPNPSRLRCRIGRTLHDSLRCQLGDSCTDHVPNRGASKIVQQNINSRRFAHQLPCYTKISYGRTVLPCEYRGSPNRFPGFINTTFEQPYTRWCCIDRLNRYDKIQTIKKIRSCLSKNVL
jgi:hypothetical protein